LVVLISRGLGADSVDPVLGIAFRGGFEAVVLGRSEDSEDVLAVGARGFDCCDGGYLREGD
jgi:hypothetical protein